MIDVKPKIKAEKLETGALKREATLLSLMVQDYCKQHHDCESLCDECHQFLVYALTRLACCPFGEKKPTCAKCKIHCYRASEKETARTIMRQTGPKMLLKHPLLTAEHLMKNLREVPDKPLNLRTKKYSEQKNNL